MHTNVLVTSWLAVKTYQTYLIVNKILDAPPETNDNQLDPVVSASHQVKAEGVKSNYENKKKRSIAGEASPVDKKPKAEAIDLTGDD